MNRNAPELSAVLCEFYEPLLEIVECVTEIVPLKKEVDFSPTAGGDPKLTFYGHGFEREFPLLRVALATGRECAQAGFSAWIERDA